MVEAFAVVAVALLVFGVVGSVVPLFPGPVLSLAGVFLYWWSTGYSDPSSPVLVGFAAVGLTAVAVDYFGGPIAAAAGGASGRTVALSAAVGVALFFVAGPLGIVLGVAGTVFVLEFRRHRDARAGLRNALFATAGVLGSALVQVLLTGAMLVGFLAIVLL